jgi:hypothetical protein
MSLYTEAKELGLEIDHHESDLYLRVCPRAKALLTETYPEAKYTIFRGTDGNNWYEIPFAFDPFWEAKPR